MKCTCVFVLVLAVSAASFGTVQGQSAIPKTLGAVISYLGLKDLGSSPATIFAPSDAAFDAAAKAFGLKSATQFLAPAYKPLLTKVLSYHVVPGKALKSPDLKTGTTLNTSLGLPYTLQVISKPAATAQEKGGVAIKGFGSTGAVTSANLALNKAVLHVVDAVLLPPGVYTSVAAAAAANPDLSSLNKLIRLTKQAVAAASNPLFVGTFFAPTNQGISSFLAANKLTVETVAADPYLTDLVLLYHASGTQYVSSSLKADTKIETLLSIGDIPKYLSVAALKPVTIKADLTKAKVVLADIYAGAAIIHTVDYPLIPALHAASAQPPTIVATQQNATSFVKLVTAAGAVNAINNPLLKATIFVPTNAALSTLASGLGFSEAEFFNNEGLADAILSYLVVPGLEVTSKNISAKPLELDPLSSYGNLTVTLVNRKPVVLDSRKRSANIVGADLDSGRNVLHIVDAVPLPGNVFKSIARAVGFYKKASTLASAVSGVPALAKAVADPKTNVTLFAPVDAAFAALPKATLSNKTLVASVLQYHIVPGARAIPHDIKSGAKLATLLTGRSLAVILNSLGKGVVQGDTNSADVVLYNVFAGRSIIQGINKVLIPKL